MHINTFIHIQMHKQTHTLNWVLSYSMRSAVTFPSWYTDLFVTRGTRKLSEPQWTQLSI